MNTRVKRLDAAPQNLRETGDFGHISDRNSGIVQCPGRAAGGKDLDATFAEVFREFNDARLVEHGQERPPNGVQVCRFGKLLYVYHAVCARVEYVSVSD